MSQPVSVSMTDFDLDLLDWLTLQSKSPNRSHTIHEALCVFAQRYSGNYRLVEQAKKERLSQGVRQRVRAGTGTLRREVIGPLQGESE